MTQQHDPAPLQEPVIGGPVDLAGIARYRKYRALATFLLALIMFGVVTTRAAGWLDWSERFPWRAAPTVTGLVMLTFVYAISALMVDAGNRVEIGLACLAAFWAVVVGVYFTLGWAARPCSTCGRQLSRSGSA